jgi:hypothetical protein
MSSTQFIDSSPTPVLCSLIPLPMEDIKMIFLSFIIWTTFYVLIAYTPFPNKVDGKPMKRLDDLDVRNRIVSFVHGSTAAVFAGYEFYTMGGNCGDPNTQY